MSNVLTVPASGAIYFDSGTAGSSTVPALTSGVSLNYDGGAGLNITSYNPSTSATDRFSVDGANGRLFSVSDSLTGTIFSVNDAAGLPIIEVNSTTTDVVNIGTYGTNALVVSGSNVGIGTATPTTKLDIKDTWNTTGTFTALKLDVTDSGSANAASLLMDLRVGGVSVSNINKLGVGTFDYLNIKSSAPPYYVIFKDAVRYVSSDTSDHWAFGSSGPVISFRTAAGAAGTNGGMSFGPSANLGWMSTHSRTGANTDLALWRDAANTLAQRNGTNAQEFRLYGTYGGTGGVDYERFFIKTNTAAATQIGVAAGGTGSYRDLEIQTGGSTRMTLTSAGNVGIGNTSPVLPLDVTGTARITSGIMPTYGNYSWGFAYHGGGPAVYGGAFASGDSRFITIRGSGTAKLHIQNHIGVNFVTFDAPAQSLGIGTATPSAKLSIVDTTLAGSGALSGSALDIAQTWNTTGTPTALSVNVTDTGSAAASSLMDLRVGGFSRFNVTKVGNLSLGGTTSSNGGRLILGVTGWTDTGVQNWPGIRIATDQYNAYHELFFQPGGVANFYSTGNWVMGVTGNRSIPGLELAQGMALSWKPSTGPNFGGSGDLAIFRDAANTLAQRNGSNAQTFRLYKTYSSSGANFERIDFRWDGDVAKIGTQRAGSGSARDLVLETDGTERVRVTAAGNVGIVSPNNSDPALDVSGGDIPLRLTRYGSASVAINRRANGTQGTPTRLISNDLIGGVLVRGHNSSTFTTTSNGGVYIYASENWTGEANGTRIGFETTANGGTTRTEKLRIEHNGNVGIGTTTPASKLTVTGGDAEITDSTKGIILKSPDGTRYRVTVDNAGALTTTAL